MCMGRLASYCKPSCRCHQAAWPMRVNGLYMAANTTGACNSGRACAPYLKFCASKSDKWLKLPQVTFH